jgi:hypothetical protein
MPFVLSNAVLLQVEVPRATSGDMTKLIVPSFFVSLMIVAMFFVFGYLRRQQGKSVRDGIEKEIKEREHELLLLAEKRKAERSRQRELRKSDAAEEEARSKVSVDAAQFFGRSCPICLLPMLEDEEIVVCAEHGAAFHLVCARGNKGCSSPGCDSFVYVHPAGVVKRWREIIPK